MVKMIGVIAISVFSLAANAASIDFNDGASGAAITNQYSALGVNFSNARYDGFVSPDEAGVGAGGLKLVGGGNGGDSVFAPKQANPIVITFDFAVSNFSITALNVGANGARAEAYDASGNLVSFAQGFGVGTGVSNHPLLTLAAMSITRVQLFQPLSGLTEGMLWDNLNFTAASAVPVPAAAWLFGSALLGLVGLRRKA